MLHTGIALLVAATCINQSGISQNSNENTSVARYRYLSTLTSGKCYRYNITTFVNNYYPVNTVEYSNKIALQQNNRAIALNLSSDEFAAKAKSARLSEANETGKQRTFLLARKADSLDALAAAKQFEATETSVNSDNMQYSTNLEQISEMQRKAGYSTDELTSAGLLSQEAEFYHSKALMETENANSGALLYVKQNLMDEAQKDMVTALLRQQSAENVYLSFQNSASVDVAMRIDSMLSAPVQLSRDNAGTIIFSVQVGAFQGSLPADQADKLLQLAGLGLTKHIEKDGLTVYTVGEYTNYTCANLLSEELVKDGFKESLIVTYTGTGKDAKRFEGIALK
jgi:hypothetical protein